ncbi:MAG: NAD(P)H-hydrate dehydratase [Candidatus Methylopumilus sp.]
MSLIKQDHISIPIRKAHAHKGDHGSVAIIGGAKSMLGAVTLASRAALLAGAGRVYASFLDEDAPSLDLIHPEIMMRAPAALPLLAQLNCVVIGPGMGTSAQANALLSFWLSQTITLVMDADALNMIAGDNQLSDLLAQRQAETIITPHAGEAARLLKTSSLYIQEHRPASALALAQQYHAVCVLKGHASIIAYQDQYFSNPTGNVGLASGGTGDVLSGIIGSLVAQGLSPLQAAKTGVYLHGAAADALVAKGIGPIGMTASEVALEVRHLLNSIK